jgi:putative peptide zinc metalloprotease protein
MPVERPTFSESWYRVAGLRPRLRSTVQVYSRHFRGQKWYVLQDPSNNQFFRQNEPAYHFVALLDGVRTVAQVWDACNEQFGDSAPTQGEVVQLLGQLYTSNLIQGEVPPDAQGLFQRYRKRVQREVKGYVANLLFARIPLLDPDRFLDRWVSVFGGLFSMWGGILWLALVAMGLYFVIGNWSGLASQADNVLDPQNLPLMAVSFWLIKIIHEFGHAFACKKFGKLAGGGEVHVMGIMFLVFTPIPYVDATSSWAFRNKWHQVIVGAAGMLVELAVASIAALVWAQTGPGPVHAIAYNMMFIASVSTLLFNANPLLRYDGYFILSDLLEIPNLSQRAKEYLYYLVRKYAWKVRQVRNPAHSRGERIWFVFYGIASTIYRFFICWRILLFIADKLFILGALLAVLAVCVWVMVPLGKFVHYLATNGELIRTRGRAVASTLGVLVAILVIVGLVPFADRDRVEAVVEPSQMRIVFAEADGWITGFLPSGTTVVPDGAPLINAVNPELQSHLTQLTSERDSLVAQREKATTEYKLHDVAVFTKGIEALDENIGQTQKDLASLTLRSKIAGTWVAPAVDRLEGAYVRKGDRIGVVADLSELIVRATAGQSVAQLLIAEARDKGQLQAEMRVLGRPDPMIPGEAGREDIWPVGRNQLPSAALGYAAGGSMATVQDDKHGTQTSEKFFEIRLHPTGDPAERAVLRPGQRILVRFELSKKPLMAQWYRSLLQLVQRRFGA